MKKAYAPPTVVFCGDAAKETRVGMPNFGIESWTSRYVGAGAVGYYL